MSAVRRATVGAGTVLLVLAGLIGAWELYRSTWMTTGWTWPFVVDNTSMPHVHVIVRALFRQPTTGTGGVLILQLLRAALFTPKEAVREHPTRRIRRPGAEFRGPSEAVM